MGGSLDPTEMVPIVSGPPGECCGEPAVLIFAATSGSADAFAATCPMCWPSAAFRMRIEGVWLGDHWLVSEGIWNYGHLSSDLAAQLGVELVAKARLEEALHTYDTPDTPRYPY
jgi:hypothetical protein